MPIQETKTLQALAHDEFELPIGFTDSEGNFHKTARLREMTGLVEEAITDQKVRNNPAKMVTEALYGVVETLGTKKKVLKDDIKGMTTTDRDFLLLMNHKVSLGDDVEWLEQCPKCEGKFDASVNIDTLPVLYMTEDEPKEMTIELPNGVKDAEGNVYKKVRVSLPTGLVQEKILPLIQQNPSQAITQMLAQITEDIEGLNHWNFTTFQAMTKKDRKHISSEMGKTKVGVDLSPSVACPNCGNTYTTTIPVMTLLGE